MEIFDIGFVIFGSGGRWRRQSLFVGKLFTIISSMFRRLESTMWCFWGAAQFEPHRNYLHIRWELREKENRYIWNKWCRFLGFDARITDKVSHTPTDWIAFFGALMTSSTFQLCKIDEIQRLNYMRWDRYMIQRGSTATKLVAIASKQCVNINETINLLLTVFQRCWYEIPHCLFAWLNSSQSA